MNENYLLHNETAKKLYFEYAKDLPIIALCSQSKSSDKPYNNIAEAFLLNDDYKLDAMRECGIDEKYITGDVSDYEKFKVFCSALPEFAGHSVYLLSHIELQKNFDCFVDICAENIDILWKECNDFIAENCITEQYLLKKSCVIAEGCLLFDDLIKSLFFRREIQTFNIFEKVIIDEILAANGKGYKNAIITLGDDFIKPNPYAASEIYKKYFTNYEQLSLDEYRLLFIQIIRDVGILCKELSWNWLYEYLEPNSDFMAYLHKSNALPRINRIYIYDTYDTSDDLEFDICRLAMQTCLGKTACTVDFSSVESVYARNDYFRRIVCNIIGKWVENGEYTSDEKILKKLIEDILYNNLKEAIS